MRIVTSLALFLTVSLTLYPCLAEAGVQDDVNQAVTILERFEQMPEGGIPSEIFRNAKGLAVVSVFKLGFILSGRGGSGIVIARTPNGWSGPSAIGMGGAGFGFQAGGQVTEFVFVLNTYDAVKAFSRGGNFQLGADLSVAAGPFGRSAEAGVTPVAAVYTYSISQGLFAGVSLEGTVVMSRDDANTRYYSQLVTPDDILSGRVLPPPGTERLQQVLSRH